MNTAVAVLCVVLLSGMAQAQDFASRAEWLVYDTRYRVDVASPFNPGKHLIKQPDQIVSSELRPDFAWASDDFGVNLKPRLLLNWSGDDRSDQSWLNEANARWRIAEDVSLSAGREVLLWGPAQFWNPSNPFYLNNGKGNVKRELSGKGFVRARWQAADAWSLAVISQINNGPFDQGVKRIDALKIDWVGEEASAAAIVAVPPGASMQWRGWAQRTLDDACLLYSEAAWARRTALVAQRAATPTGWQVASGNDRYALDAIVGAAYTFLNGWTLNTEYYRHGSGLSSSEMADWNNLAHDASARLSTSALAPSQLAAALDPGTNPLGRKNLGVQLRNGNDETFGWNLRYSRNLDDRSGQVVTQVNVDLSNRWQLWANVTIQHGGASGSEYGRWLDSSAMLGVTAFLW